MGRKPRAVSSAGFYHVVIRGNGKQLLFEDDSDRRYFLELMDRVLPAHGLTLIAWCLMDNHVHLCMRNDVDESLDNLSEAMRSIQVAYAARFNSKTGHVGHVFQGRFESFAIEDARYLLEVVRYIHDNPHRAGMCAMDEYPWSSYCEYLGPAVRCDTSVVLDELGGGVAGFLEYSRMGSDDFSEPVRQRHVLDEKALEVARTVLDPVEPDAVKSLPREQRDRALRELRGAGLSVRQIVRLTGLGKNTITRATTR